MNAKFDLLDHAVDLFPAPERALDRLVRRRSRKRRNQRITSTIVALVVAAAAIGAAITVFDRARVATPTSYQRWTKSYPTWGHDGDAPIAVDRTGVYAAVDSLYDGQGAGRSDVVLRKFDAQGNEVWARRFGTAGEDDAKDLVTFGGDVYLLGNFGFAGHSDIFLRRYTADGTLVWQRTIATARWDDAHELAVDASGVYVIGGTSEALPGQNTGGAFIRRYDLNGDEVWTIQPGDPHVDLSGITLDASGAYVVGNTYTGDGRTYQTDAFLRKYGFEGSEIWTRSIAGPKASENLYGIASVASGVVVVGDAARVLPGQDHSGTFVRVYTSQGIETWTRQSGGGEYPWGDSITADDTGVYVAGFAGNHAIAENERGFFVRKLSLQGQELWTRRLEPSGRNGEWSIGIAVAGTAVYVNWETGPHTSQHDLAGEWKAYVTELSAPPGP